jgi:16S rRNA (uracil1498-N3)-methyltransferase
MATPRFYIDADLRLGVPVPLPADVAHHAIRVLRLRDGATITAFNGRGGESHGRLLVDGARASAVLERFDPIERESPARVTLVQAWVAADKLEWIAEKAVELGAAAIVLVPTARSVVQLDGPRRDRRLQRLKEIVVSSCCQCGRNRVPEVRSAATLQQGLEAALDAGAFGLLLDPHAGEPIAAVLPSQGPLALLVGPEGGLDASEQSLAARNGYRPVTLGPRILRTETAGLAGLTALQLLCGDMR